MTRRAGTHVNCRHRWAPVIGRLPATTAAPGLSVVFCPGAIEDPCSGSGQTPIDGAAARLRRIRAVLIGTSCSKPATRCNRGRTWL